ncbi:class I SAM-dependent methyltransferase [Maribacter sp. MAR_2009_72]|uniref:class I SAM-dependent methyltransferase n=1 Tax=Maribacter sp. MAR_2009_72 TaxID=1250050 RepID=UPI00119C3EB8|nr:class I SAM-dependent methyltransferase [Maribacter sp. MAR_2009_72]TVZ13808.1 protein-L-isoaspartate(D-aspartate) O-methyltransferase (PCMT) [Maribacter sp. MAR_2009_72]TVZ17445.1 protein-L-isoaspartate(D-aspartate) O-methyltransferase (PCMT) [Maribacter sp. MAR_2009_72]
MNPAVLSDEVQQFINEHLSTDVHKLLLKKSPFVEITSKELVEQIESKAKAKHKLPTWFNTEKIYYPNKLNLSQTSSEITAAYKASLLHGSSLIDLTGGFGVDTYAFAKIMQQVVHIEKNMMLSKIAAHNFEQLGIANIDFHIEDGIAFLRANDLIYDWIFIDPSRRDKDNKKVFYLKDCEPNITEQFDFLFSKANNIMVKTGPLLDINNGLTQMAHVKEIHIIAVSNDVKELLWILNKDYTGEPHIKTINFKDANPQLFDFILSDEKNALANYSLPRQYLYEPNASILKSGAFQHIANAFSLYKLHLHSHIYTSDKLITFPGRRFIILETLDYSKKSIKQLKLNKANLTTRNFPDNVKEIRKKLKLKEGGYNYLFCTTTYDERLKILICEQIF